MKTLLLDEDKSNSIAKLKKRKAKGKVKSIYWFLTSELQNDEDDRKRKDIIQQRRARLLYSELLVSQYLGIRIVFSGGSSSYF